MKSRSLIGNPHRTLIVNFAYGIGNAIVGFASHSWWFITAGAYYTVLATARFCVLQIRRKANADPGAELFARRTIGLLLVVLSVCIAGVNTLSLLENRGTVFHEIVMIAIATYTFTKITMAIIGITKTKHKGVPTELMLRNITLADACVSVYTMQRSMLVTFPGMDEATMKLFNILTGTAVWITVLFLGIHLIGGKITMAKSKIIEVNEKIAETVTDGYKKIEKGVVEGYKKIEQGVVDGFGKIEDKFVDAYLTKEGETVEEAKARLKQEHK